MSLKTVLVTIETSALAALKEAGHIIEDFVISETQKLVALVKASDLGTKAMNIVSELESATDTGSEKMAKLIGMVAGDLADLHAAGGLAGLETSIESFAKEFGQSVYNDFKAAAAGVVGKL